MGSGGCQETGGASGVCREASRIRRGLGEGGGSVRGLGGVSGVRGAGEAIGGGVEGLGG